jgi:DNA polymerase III sliding clamp (beta) subunit (PCNA family)
MLVNKSKLQEALGIVRPGLAKKEEVEQSTSFAFINGRVVTYDDDISISHPVEGIELEGAIESDKLYQLLTKIKPKKDQKEDELEIDIEIEENEVIITSGKIKAGLSLQSEIKLPLTEEIEEKGKWKRLPDDFLKFVGMCIPSCGIQKTKPILTCVHVNKAGFVEASDGYRITHCDFPEGFPVNTFLIPSKSARLMLTLQPISIAEGKGWIHFKTTYGTILSCRLFDDIFPDTAPYLAGKGKQIVFPRSINDVLERANIFTEYDLVSISLQDKKLKINAKFNTGWFEEEVNAKYEDEPISFMINPGLLKGILKETQSGELAKNKMLFRGEGWIYMTTLTVENK